MKIRNGRDYYDSVQYGSDDDSYFVRDCIYRSDVPSFKTTVNGWVVNPLINMDSTYAPNNYNKKDNVDFVLFSVYFAGKFFSVAATTFNSKNIYKDMFGCETTGYECFYNFEDLKNHFVDNALCYNDIVKRKAEFNEYFDFTYSKKLHDYMLDNAIVTAIIFKGTPNDTVDDILQEHVAVSKKDQLFAFTNSYYMAAIQFYKVYDAYTAFQEIDMYVNGVLANSGKELVKISDRSKIAKAGFDFITSFRHPVKIPRPNRKQRNG